MGPLLLDYKEVQTYLVGLQHPAKLVVYKIQPPIFPMSTKSTVINLSNQQINVPCSSDSHISRCDYPMYLSETTQILKALAFASRPSGSGYRQKREGSAGRSQSTSTGFSSEEEEPSQKRRKVPVVVSVEDSVAQYFAKAIHSPGTKERKMSMAEKDLKVKESQDNAMVDLLKSAVDSPGTKAAKIAVQKTSRRYEVARSRYPS